METALLILREVRILLLAAANERFAVEERLTAAGFEVIDLVGASNSQMLPLAAVTVGAESIASESGSQHEVAVVSLGPDSAEQAELIGRLKATLANGSAQPAPPEGFAAIVGESAELQRVKLLLQRLSERPRAAVLIRGEAGTGRRHLAAALHAATFPDGEWVYLTPSRAEAELDSLLAAHRKRSDLLSGSGVTLCIPEVGDLSSAALDRVLGILDQDSARPIRLIACTTAAEKDRTIPRELRHRFVVEVSLPPLRERMEDVRLLVDHLKRYFEARCNVTPLTLTEAAYERLADYDWPGNVTELKTVLERLVAFSGKSKIDAEDLPDLVRAPRDSGFAFVLPSTGVNLAALERDALVQALAATGNNHTKAAALLGITRDQLRYRTAKLALETAPAPASRRR